jgi:hypothetical protein
MKEVMKSDLRRVVKVQSTLFFVLIFLSGILRVTGQDQEAAVQDPVKLPVFSTDYQRYVTTLASDEFEGREPLTPGGLKTKDFIEAEFARIGLKPAFNGTYRQPVPVIKTSIVSRSDFAVSKNDQQVTFTTPDQFLFSASVTEGHYELNSELVFAGYGIVAPEYDWDDYGDMDLMGKTVLVLYNDPGYQTGNENFFQGKTLSPYAHLEHKYEQALLRGATAMLLIHEHGSPYSWDLIHAYTSKGTTLLEEDVDKPKLKVIGIVTWESAKQIMAMSGYCIDHVKKCLIYRESEAMPLGLNVSLSFDTEKKSGSYNIAGFIEGSEYPEETVIYVAHWDHMGKTDTEIFNGAIDNASGTAALMAIAGKFASMDPPPARTVLFLAVTAEESGLHGSRHYVKNPLFPLETTAGVINIDMVNVTGPTRDLLLTGYGYTDFQEILRRKLRDNNRILKADHRPGQNYFFRSDHYSFARAGVPVIYTRAGIDFAGPDAQKMSLLYDADDKRYHTSDDKIHDHWSWQAIDNDLWIYFLVGEELANSRRWPKWNDGTPFKAEREKSDHLRKPAGYVSGHDE